MNKLYYKNLNLSSTQTITDTESKKTLNIVNIKSDFTMLNHYNDRTEDEERKKTNQKLKKKM